MLLRLAPVLTLAAIVLFAPRAEAVPVYFSIDTCTVGDCAAFHQSGQGAIVAELDVINGNDLLITLTNGLNAYANGDDPHLTNIGFEYGSLLSGLTFDSFTVLSGTVARPTLTVDTSIRSFFIDFGFVFPDDRNRDNWFQAANPNEIVQMVVGTTGDVDLSQFLLGVAKVGGAGEGGLSGAITLTGEPSTYASVPEPTSLALVGVGFAALCVRRSRAPQR
jgi:hypothetical protein